MGPKLFKRIVCLAYSRMPGGHCVAGRELLNDCMPGPWIRPVSNRDNEGVTPYQCRYAIGGNPRLLDIMDVPVLRARPHHHQQENWLIDTNRRWNRIGQLDPTFLPKWTEKVGQLWVNGSKTSAGLNDRVSLQDSKSLRNSLHLIEVDLTLMVFNHYDRRRVQGRFLHSGINYWMWVTDPNYEDEYKNEVDGAYSLGRCFLCISLGGVFDGFAYKLIAAIIKP